MLLGANGAGKTTLMDLISGKTKSTEGRVFLLRQRHHQQGGARNRPRRGRPQVSDPERVQGTARAPESGSCELPRSPACCPICGFGFSRESRAGVSTRCSNSIGLSEQAATARRQSQPWPDPVARAWPADRAEPEGAAARRADRRHDQAETHKTAEIINGLKGSHTLSSSSTTWRLCARSPSGSPSCISARSSPKATSAEIETESESARSLSRFEGDPLMLKLVQGRQLLRPQPHPARRQPRRRPGEDHSRARPQRHRQDDPAQDASWA